MTHKLAPGQFLIAGPNLTDPNFHRTVVLVVQHDESGTFGVVLNRPTDLLAPSLCSTLEIEWCGSAEDGIDWLRARVSLQQLLPPARARLRGQGRGRAGGGQRGTLRRLPPDLADVESVGPMPRTRTRNA